MLTSAGNLHRYIRTAAAIDRFRDLSAQIRRVGRVVDPSNTRPNDGIAAWLNLACQLRSGSSVRCA